MDDLIGARIHITGIVQGVGFRPFVYALAKRLALTGWVRNTSAGVDIEVDGTPQALEEFTRALKVEAPPLARIDEFNVDYQAPNGFSTFQIGHSQPIPDAFQPISPDVSICQDCLNELYDPNDRRYLYPFINCTNCGPRFTIIEDIPYDRPKTTMATFVMCPDCAAEYNAPQDRRFHAQPIACPACGPQVWLELKDDRTTGEHLIRTPAILETRRLLLQGQIVAIKGLGGFHLACDAMNSKAVAELRHRKLRVDKPFALMMPDIGTVEVHCSLDQVEGELLESRQRPIVILQRRPQSPISSQVAPGQNTLGVMLPYTPLHYLLFESGYKLSALVMTSGNLGEEPIATDNNEARERLWSLADAFLMHDRPIRTRCDDSVMRVFQTFTEAPLLSLTGPSDTDPTMPIRRSRGYAPFPVRLPWSAPPLFAAGAELKNTFCITREQYAFLSHHIGDMENYETLRSFEDGVVHFERLFRIQPQALAYDLHPDYLATRYAQERAEREGLPAIGVQHHHAHIAACMAEHGLSGEEPVIGASFDGTGFGEDGAVWGGEFLVADYRGYQRPFHLAYVPLPGGDKAVREPWRMALTWLTRSDIPWSEHLPPLAYVTKNLPNPSLQLETLHHQIQTGLNAPLTSSMGRLFDAVAALIGVRQKVNYEAQAAIELEALIDGDEFGFYPLEFLKPASVQQAGDERAQEIDASPLIQAVVSDLQREIPIPVIAARFHNSLAQMVLQVCQLLRDRYHINAVALSGGVWQNMTLLRKTIDLLVEDHFVLYMHRRVPTNDGGLALGQAAVATQKMAEGS